MPYKSMEIYLVNVPYDEANGSKERPALIVRIINDNQVQLLKITSEFDNKSKDIQQLYYPIKQWEKAGLRKKSYIDCHKSYQLPKEAIITQQPFGSLTREDIKGLFDFISPLIASGKISMN